MSDWMQFDWEKQSHNRIYFNRHPPSGDPAEGDQSLACVPAALAHFSDLLIQIHLEALSAASVTDLMETVFTQSY